MDSDRTASHASAGHCDVAITSHPLRISNTDPITCPERRKEGTIQTLLQAHSNTVFGSSTDGSAGNRDKESIRDPLTFRPLVLRPWFLFMSVSFNLAVMTLLGVICAYQRFDLLGDWEYFVVQILPLIIGTVTAAKLEAIVSALSRMTPFMRCACPDGDTAATSILMPYVPILSLSASISSKNWHLVWAKLTLWLGYNALAFKSALLSASLDDRRAEATDWVVYALLTGYFLITLFTGWVAYYLHNRRTGFRKGWETLNIADHLALFRHSNFLDAFEGSGIATRESMIAELGSKRLRLGYWPLDCAETTARDTHRTGVRITVSSAGEDTSTQLSGSVKWWYGFQEVDEDNNLKLPPRFSTFLPSCEDQDSKATVRELSKLRYNSVFGIMRSSAALRYSIIAFVCLVGYVLALSLVNPHTKVFKMRMSPNLTAFILGYVVTYVFSLFSFFWEEMYLFAAITEPFVAMDKPEGADADQALLLNYTGSPRFIAMFDAASRGHWKVFRTGVYATLQRSLPIIVGASIKIVPISPYRSEVQFSTPLSIIVIVFMVVYLVVIPYEVFEAGYSRHLPRDCLTIGDLLSWTCCSSILRKSTITLNDDQLEEKLPPTNPLDTRSDAPHNEKWYMEARLRLAQQRFSMGLIRVSSRNGVYMVGIDTSTAARLYRPTKGLRRRIAGTSKKEGNRAENPETTYKVAGVGQGSAFTRVTSSEKNHFSSCQDEGAADLLRSVMPRDLGEVV